MAKAHRPTDDVIIQPTTSQPGSIEVQVNTVNHQSDSMHRWLSPEADLFPGMA